MESRKQSVGKRGEELACQILKKQGLKIIDRNYYCRFGELDVVCSDQSNQIVFVEVKTLTAENFIGIRETLTIRKVQHLHKAIQYWLISKGLQGICWRLDFCGIVLAKNQQSIKKLLINKNIL